MRARGKQQRFVPMKSFLNTAIWLRQGGVSVCKLSEVRRHEMIRVPKLQNSTVSNSPEGAAARRTPVRGKDRLPHDKYVYSAIGLSRQ